MKPKTKLQVEVWDLHKKLPNPKEHEQFVISNHKFYYTTHYKNIVCLECNHSWRDDVKPIHKCPNCNKKLEKIITQNGAATRIIVYAIAQVVDRFQVVRYFSCWKEMRKNKPPHYWFRSLFEEWKEYEKNKTVIVGRTQSWSGDGFSYSDYEIRDYGKRYWYGSPYKNFSSDINCPGAEFLPQFQKYGLTSFRHDCDYRMLIEALSNPKIETLLKAKQKELLTYAIYKEKHHHNRWWVQIKIALRNKYKITDPGMWYDYLELLHYFNKDIRNPKFVCPKNLKQEHNKLVAKKERIREQQRIQEEIQKQENERAKAEAEEALRGIKAEVFGNFKITNSKFQIIALVDEEEVKKEGKILKHCVYTNNYHKKSGILLLSARIDGQPIETIELSLANYKVIQARGFDNEATEYHNEILELLNKNIRKISKIVEKQKKLKQLDSALKELEQVA